MPKISLRQILNADNYAENDSTQTTTSTSFVTALSLNIVSPGADYISLIFLEGLSSQNSANLEARVLIDGTVEASSIVVPIRDTDEWFPYMAMSLNGLLPGTRTISVQYRTTNNQIVQVRRTRIFALELS